MSEQASETDSGDRCHPQYLSARAHRKLSQPGAFDGVRIHTDELQEVICRLAPGTLSHAVVGPDHLFYLNTTYTGFRSWTVWTGSIRATLKQKPKSKLSIAH